MIVEVAVPVNICKTFHYDANIAGSEGLELGSLVSINFNQKATYGFIVGFPKEERVPTSFTIKPIEKVVLEKSPFSPSMIQFLKWTAEYYCYPVGEVFSAALPKQHWVYLSKENRKPLKLKFFEGVKIPSKPILDLTAEQKSVLEVLHRETPEKAFLLHGVTGSGKTEVYLQMIRSTLEEGKGAIVLVPEISLTPQLIGRFSQRFPNQIAVLHSDLTPKERFEEWEKIRTGIAPIVIGVRSAIFAPVSNLGLLIVDEEHETSFKQEDSLRYHARDLSVVRGKIEKAKVILGSATPSLETFYNAKQGKYHYLRMESRVENRVLPQMKLIDLKNKDLQLSPKFPWLTRPLFQAIEKCIAQGEQSILFLNRLGYAHFLFCKDCGHSWRCLNCDVSLTYYVNPPHLLCHYCQMTQDVPNTCELCEGMSIQKVGVGTEQLEKTLKELLPKARIARMDRSVLKNRKDLENLLNQIANREMDIIIGTQMVTKGHDFPNVSLVGVLCADASLNLPDFRSVEKTFQVLTQVAGRAGRGDKLGEVWVQTLNPKHPIFNDLNAEKIETFYVRELEKRRNFGFPPFERLVLLKLQHRDESKVSTAFEHLKVVIENEIKKNFLECEILGPAPAPMVKIKNMVRWQMLLKGKNHTHLKFLVNGAREYLEKHKYRLPLSIDVDPMHLM